MSAAVGRGMRRYATGLAVSGGFLATAGWVIGAVAEGPPSGIGGPIAGAGIGLLLVGGSYLAFAPRTAGAPDALETGVARRAATPALAFAVIQLALVLFHISDVIAYNTGAEYSGTFLLLAQAAANASLYAALTAIVLGLAGMATLFRRASALRGAPAGSTKRAARSGFVALATLLVTTPWIVAALESAGVF